MVAAHASPGSKFFSFSAIPISEWLQIGVGEGTTRLQNKVVSLCKIFLIKQQKHAHQHSLIRDLTLHCLSTEILDSLEFSD